LGVEFHNFSEEFEHPRHLLLLKIVAEAPVAKHLKSGGVSVITNFINVVGTEADLAISQAHSIRVGLAEQIWDHRLHAGAGEERGGIFFGYQVGARNYHMGFVGKEFEVLGADFLGVHRLIVADTFTCLGGGYMV